MLRRLILELNPKRGVWLAAWEGEEARSSSALGPLLALESHLRQNGCFGRPWTVLENLGTYFVLAVELPDAPTGERCGDCSGSGKVALFTSYGQCPACQGAGIIPAQSTP